MEFALALEAAATRGDDARAILTGCLGAVVFTTLVVGGLTTRALGWLGIEMRTRPGPGEKRGQGRVGSIVSPSPPSRTGSRSESASASAALREGSSGDRCADDDRSSSHDDDDDDDDVEAGTRALVTSGRSDGGTRVRNGGNRNAAGGSRGNLADVSAPVRVSSAEDVDYMEHARTIMSSASPRCSPCRKGIATGQG